MNDTAPPSAASRLAFVIGRYNRRLQTASGGLSHGLLSALSSVSKSGPLRLAELAQIELVAAPSITRVVAELEYRGLVGRKVDPEDRRAFLIQVTDEGVAAIDRARAARADVVAATLEGLDDAQVAAIVAALPALEQAIGAV